MNVLEEAARIVDGDRNDAYGDPEGNHGTTAAMWTAYLRRRGLLNGELDAHDVCLLNILQKCSRDAHDRRRDSLVDIAGYARNAEIVGETPHDATLVVCGCGDPCPCRTDAPGPTSDAENTHSSTSFDR